MKATSRKRTKAQPKKRTRLYPPPLPLRELDSRLRQEASRVANLYSVGIEQRNAINELRDRVDVLEAWMDRFANRRARRGAA